jgi:O-antigen ligase
LQAVGSVTAGVLILWFLSHQRKLYTGNVLLPLFLLGVVILASFLYARNVDPLVYFFRKWFFNMLFAVLLVNLVTRFETFKKVLWVVMLMAVINAAAAILDYSSTSEYYHRSTGLLENANEMGSFAALAFPLALYQYLYQRGVLRWVGLLFSGLLVGGVVVSVSRGATLSAVTVFLVIMVLERRKTLPLLLVVALALCALPFIPTYFSERVGNLASDVERSLVVTENRELTSRGYILSGGLKIWASHPILGVGLGNFGWYYVEKEFNPGDYRRTRRMVPHSIYIQALAETGLVGTTLLVWLLWLAVRNALKARRLIRTDENRWMYFGALEMMTLAVLISNASTGNFMSQEFWLFICLTAMSSRVATAMPDEASSAPPPAAAPAR